MKNKKENFRRLHMSTYLKSLDVENVIGIVQSPRLHKIYDMVKLCVTIGLDK
jgi:hypothetical protein